MWDETRPSASASELYCVLSQSNRKHTPRSGWARNQITFGLVFLLFLVAGCSAGYYRRTADRDVYRIVDQTEAQIFGRTNTFTIATPYSGRNPADIQPSELISDRLDPGKSG